MQFWTNLAGKMTLCYENTVAMTQNFEKNSILQDFVKERFSKIC